jgi:hypothetical protein
MKTNELTGSALDWAVATSLGLTAYTDGISWIVDIGKTCIQLPKYSTEWAKGGPIIERENISTQSLEGVWSAFFRDKLFEEDNSECWQDGPTPLIAAMRCYVASKLGDDVTIPEELTA